MARRGGFFAELERQSRLAAQQRERAHRAAVRDHNAAVRAAEQARRASERANAQLARASEADRKRLEKEARESHIASMEAQVAEQNATLSEAYDDIDTLLAATLAVDDYVDLETLRRPVEHPPFDRADLEQPIPPPTAIPDPAEPVLSPPAPPTGLTGIFGKKKHAEAVTAAEQAHAAAVEEWKASCVAVAQRREADAAGHQQAEAARVEQLAAERARYAAECTEREATIAEDNRALDELIANLGYGTTEAVQEYVSIVLSHSVYPEHFPVSHEFAFDPGSAELTLRALVPGPASVPDVKAYKYTKASDEITASKLSQKDCKDRYAAAVHQVALRSMHEVFEADRRGLIKTVALEVGTNTIDPATGKPTYVPFVAVGAHRDHFLEFDLAAVVPTATLSRLGAATSKDPYNLVAADLAGVRRA